MDGRRHRVIGLLGGMSWESSAEYYRLVNEVVRERLGGLHSARCVLASVDFAVIEELQVAGRWDEAGSCSAAEASDVEAAGATCCCCARTPCTRWPTQVQAAIGIPLLHIADVAAEAVIAAGLQTVGLLGTAFTMEQDFYRDPARRPRTHRPRSARRRTAPRCTGSSTTSCAGASCGRSHGERYQAVIDRLVEAGAQGVILGCTEIELLVRPQDSPVPVFPTTRLHVAAAAGHRAGSGHRAEPGHRADQPIR